MDPQVWTIIGAIATGLLVPITGALGVWGAAQVKRWQAKSDLKTLRDNAKAAVEAIQQLYPEADGAEKKRLAMTWAAHLNTVAGISAGTETQTILNESSVLAMKQAGATAAPVSPCDEPAKG
jgi:hypothetical protein